MKSGLAKFFSPGFILTVCFTLNIAAQNPPAEAAISADKPEIVAAKREIIKLLLGDIFRSETKEQIYLSRKNIPRELQEDFPEFENLTTRFITPTAENAEDLCPFEFDIFSVSAHKAAVVFGDCRNGLGYNFEKVGGRWKFAPLEIERY